MRRRLIGLAGAVAAMVVVAFLVPLAFLVRDLARDRALSTAERNTQIVAQNLSLVPSGDRARIEAVLDTVAARSEEQMSVVLADDSILGAQFELTELEVRARLGESISTSITGGAAVVVPVIQAEGTPLVVRSFVSRQLLTRNVWSVVALLGLVGAVLILIAVAVADRMSRSLVEPVQELSAAAARVSQGDLNARVQPAGPPEVVEVGTAFNQLAVLDFDLVSSLEDTASNVERRAPAWEGAWQGLKFLQLFEGDYGGLQRSFATILARDGSIEVWELTTTQRNDQDDNRVEWFVETPAWTWGREFELKRLDGGEIWIDRVYGTVYMDVYYRPDAEACWQFWHRTEFCSARTSCEDLVNPVCYPEQPYGEGHKFPVTLPTPPYAQCNRMNARPMNIGYQFQMKIILKGWCRIRGIMVHAIPVQKAPFDGMSCGAPPTMS